MRRALRGRRGGEIVLAFFGGMSQILIERQAYVEVERGGERKRDREVKYWNF
jgi:hypothetical protein